MIGLFQGKILRMDVHHAAEPPYWDIPILTFILENGPCHFVNGASTPSLNPYSFNTYANMLYVDQPIGTGFSYGTDSVTSTVTAAPYVWTLLQAFYAQFPQYESRAFGVRIFVRTLLLRHKPMVCTLLTGIAFHGKLRRALRA